MFLKAPPISFPAYGPVSPDIRTEGSALIFGDTRLP